MKHRVLVTGSAGRVGRAAVKALVANGHHVVGFDVRPTPGLPANQSVVGTLADAETLRSVAKDVTRIIHLAATPDDTNFPRGTPPNDGDNFVDELVPNNVVGLYNLMEAARKGQVPRVILASTGQVIGGHLDSGNTPVNGSTPFAPRYLYACTKVFLEAMGQVYAKQHDIAVIAVRLGWCPRDARQVAEIAAAERFQDVYLSPGDVGRFFTAAVEAKDVAGFHVTYATSKPLHTLLYDLRETTQLIGFEPKDSWPTGASEG